MAWNYFIVKKALIPYKSLAIPSASAAKLSYQATNRW